MLPQDAGLVWAVMDIDKTLLGSLMTTLLKALPVKLEVTTVGGSREEYRLPPLMAHTGFQLSPLVQTKEDFARLYLLDSPSEGKHVAQILLKVQGGFPLSIAYCRNFSIRFYRLEFKNVTAR